MPNEKNAKISAWFEGLTAEQSIMAEQLREIIFNTNSSFIEDLKWNMPNYSLHKLVCYLQKSKTHLTVGFQQGAHLNDPEACLQGTGKDMRHIKFAINEPINEKLVVYFVEQAIGYDQKNL